MKPKLFALSGNAGWITASLNEDHMGWLPADFVFKIHDNGTVTFCKNRTSGETITLLSTKAAIKYMQNYYDFCCTGVDVSSVEFHSVSSNNRKMLLNQLRQNKNKTVTYLPMDEL